MTVDSMMVFPHSLLLLLLLTICATQEQGDIRLNRGSSSLSRRTGIVQVFDSGTWTTLCGNNFGNTEASAVCKSFGFQNGTRLPASAFARLDDATPYKSVLGFTGCHNGTDLGILSCDFEETVTCADVDVNYASVNCFNTSEAMKDKSVKLEDERTSDSGYFSTVLVYQYDMWGQVCGQYWDDGDALVVCKQLGFQGGVATYMQSDWSIARLLSETGCDGSEDSLSNCSYSDLECLTDKVAGVVCYKTQEPSLQLVGGKTHFGRVVLNIDGMQGLFCEEDPRWTYLEANAVCKTLGYTSGFVITDTNKENITSPGISSVFIEKLSCTGDEDSIYQCDLSGWKNLTGNCNDISNAAAVYCYTQGSESSFPYFEQDNVHMGRVELYDDGDWHAVCADTFSQTDANIVCTQLGFTKAEISLPGNFRQAYFTVSPISNLTCTGTETSLTDCSYTKGRCQMYNLHATVICTQDNVLSNIEVSTPSLSNSYHGDVIIERHGVKGRICRTGWDDQDAAVVCKSLNYATGFAFGTPLSYRRANPVWASNFTCGLGEDGLLNCGYQSNLGTDWSCARDYSEAGVLCYTAEPPAIKVGRHGGTRPDTFRAEIYHDQSGWGTICDDGTWSNADAQVYCRELGYPYGQATRNGFMQGESSQTVVISGVQCTGKETSILQCPNNGWQQVSATLCNGHTKDAGVFCYRWVKTEPTQSFGAVLYHSGENYGLVCADGFDDNAALAVCREQTPFPFSYGKALCCSAAGPDSRPITLSNVSCTGSEQSLRECSYNDVNPECSSGLYASVACADSTFGYTKLEATPVVKVTYLTQQGYVCTDGFTDADSAVICRQLGFSFSRKLKSSSRDYSNKIRWLRGFGCLGEETAITACKGLTWGNIGVCTWDAVAAVRCTNNQDDLDFDVRIVNGTTIAGRVEIKVDNQWGTMCGNDVTKNEASVICKQLGYHDGIGLPAGFYGAGAGPVHLNGFECEGSEYSVEECIWSGYKDVSSLCDHTKDAAVNCFDNIQLSGSTTVNYGRLEVYDSTEDDWVAVCDSSVTTNDARLICRQLGYTDGLVHRGSPLGPTDVNIAITKVNCDTITKCSFTHGQCSTGRYAALYCSDSAIDNENFNIRLPLNSFYGPVSVRRYGLWGHVCSVGFDNTDAAVVCKKLGYQDGKALKTFQTDGFPIIQGNVNCNGDETDLSSCGRDPFVTDPGCYDVNTVAGVMCYNDPGLSLSSVSLDPETGKMTSIAGLELNSAILRIAYKGFTDLDASVYCNYLGYAGGEVYRSFRGGYGISGIECDGTEESILGCPGTWDPSQNEGQEGDLAGVICYTSVRLVAGDPRFYGAVYASKGVNSGPVCFSSGFDANAARVACKSLGYDSGLVLCCSPFGVLQDIGIISINQCTGSELQLTDCDHEDIVDDGTCSTQYASVVCYNTPRSNEYTVYLSGSTEYTGHVMISYLGINGSICRDGWNDASASVACKELGYRRGVAYNAVRSSMSAGPFWLSNVQCTGNEARLMECQSTGLGTVNECLSWSNQAGVICYDNEGLFYRLGGTDETRYGRVEMSINGEWRSICNLYWDNNDSHVLCKMLGFSTGEAYQGTVNRSLSGPVWEVNYQCDRTETDLNFCVSTGWRVSTQPTCAQHRNDAGTFCYKSVKLSTGVGRETDQGAVLLYKDDRWYTVCCDGFNDTSASVVCQELGFKDGQALSCSSFGELDEYNLLQTQKISCSGKETEVQDCLVNHQCLDDKYASVVCYNFLNTTEPLPASKEKMNYTPIIIAVVVFVVLLVITIMVAICIVKWRRHRKITKSKERFDNTIVSEHRDGSIIARNRLSGLVGTPEVPRVQYNRNRGNGNDAAELMYDNRDYSNLNPPAEYDNGGYSKLYDNQGPNQSREPTYSNEQELNREPAKADQMPSKEPGVSDQVPGPFSKSGIQARSKTVTDVQGNSSLLKFGNNVYDNNVGREEMHKRDTTDINREEMHKRDTTDINREEMHKRDTTDINREDMPKRDTTDINREDMPKRDTTDINRLSLSQQDEVQVSKDEYEGN